MFKYVFVCLFDLIIFTCPFLEKKNQREISKSKHFFHPRSKHEEIDLVTEEEFYKEAPQEISRPQLTKNDNHQLTLARLDWELEQRKRCENLSELLH